MRDILNISLPKDMAEEIKREAKARHSTVSELVRAAIRLYREEKLWKDVKKSRRQIKQGKFVKAPSLRDL